MLLKENVRRQAEKNAQTFSKGISSVLSPLTCHVILRTHVLRMRPYKAIGERLF